jgi:hypothetical protein
MKKLVTAVILVNMFSLAALAERVETVHSNIQLDGVAAECDSQQNHLSAKIFFKDSQSTAGIGDAAIYTDMRTFSEIEKMQALKICRILINLAEQNAVVTLFEGFNYEGPGSIVGFQYDGNEYLLPQVTK